MSNAVSYKSNMTSVTVEEAITMLSVNSPAGSVVEVDVLTGIDIGMASGSDYECDFKLLYDNGSSMSFQRTELDGLVFDYTFTLAGYLTLSVNCSNHLGFALASKDLHAVERLTNVALSPPGAVAGEEYYFMLTWSRGTNVSLVTFKYDGVDVNDMTVYETLRQAMSTNSRMEAITGIHTVEYILENALGSVSVPSTNFVIEIEMSNVIISSPFPNQILSVTSEYVVIPLNSDVQTVVSMDAGTSVKVEADYGDGNTFSQSAMIGMPWATAEPTFTFPIVHTFTTAGYFSMVVTVSNSFSSVTRTYPVAVMVGVDTTEINSVSAVRFDPPAVVTFTFAPPSPPPNDVWCRIDWGDGNYDEYYPCDLEIDYPHEYLDADGM